MSGISSQDANDQFIEQIVNVHIISALNISSFSEGKRKDDDAGLGLLEAPDELCSGGFAGKLQIIFR